MSSEELLPTLRINFRPCAIPVFLLHDPSEFVEPSTEDTGHHFEGKHTFLQLPVNGRNVNFTRLNCSDEKENIYLRTIYTKEKVDYENSPIHGDITVFVSSFSPCDSQDMDSPLSLSSCLGSGGNTSNKFKYKDLTKDIVMQAIKRFDSNYEQQDNNCCLKNLLDEYFKKFNESFPETNDHVVLRDYIIKHMRGFEYGIEQNWWGASFLKYMERFAEDGFQNAPISQTEYEMMLRLYITRHESHLSNIIFHVVDGSCRCMSLEYASTGFTPTGLPVDCREQASKHFKLLPHDTITPVINVCYLPHGDDETDEPLSEECVRNYTERLTAISCKHEEDGGKAVPHDVTDLFVIHQRHMSANFRAMKNKHLCDIPSMKTLQKIGNKEGDRDVFWLDAKSYMDALKSVQTPQCEIDRIMGLGNDDVFTQEERIESYWLVYSVFRPYLKAFLQVPGSLKKIAQEVNNFNIPRLERTINTWPEESVFKDEEILDHLFLRNKKNGDWIAKISPFTSADTIFCTIGAQSKIVNALTRYDKGSYHGHRGKKASSVFSDIMLKHLYLSVWSFLDKPNAGGGGTEEPFRILLTKQPMAYYKVEEDRGVLKQELVKQKLQRTPGTGDTALMYVMNAFHATLEQFLTLREIVNSALSRQTVRTWPQERIVELALLRCCYVLGLRWVIRNGPDPIISKQDKDSWKKLSEGLLTHDGKKVKYMCTCPRGNCNCAPPFRHQTLFELVIFSYQMKKKYGTLQKIQPTTRTAMARRIVGLGTANIIDLGGPTKHNRAIKEELNNSAGTPYFWHKFIIPDDFRILDVLEEGSFNEKVNDFLQQCSPTSLSNVLRIFCDKYSYQEDLDQKDRKGKRTRTTTTSNEKTRKRRRKSTAPTDKEAMKDATELLAGTPPKKKVKKGSSRASLAKTPMKNKKTRKKKKSTSSDLSLALSDNEDDTATPKRSNAKRKSTVSDMVYVEMTYPIVCHTIELLPTATRWKHWELLSKTIGKLKKYLGQRENCLNPTCGQPLSQDNKNNGCCETCKEHLESKRKQPNLKTHSSSSDDESHSSSGGGNGNHWETLENNKDDDPEEQIREYTKVQTSYTLSVDHPNDANFTDADAPEINFDPQQIGKDALDHDAQPDQSASEKSSFNPNFLDDNDNYSWSDVSRGFWDAMKGEIHPPHDVPHVKTWLNHNEDINEGMKVQNFPHKFEKNHYLHIDRKAKCCYENCDKQDEELQKCVTGQCSKSFHSSCNRANISLWHLDGWDKETDSYSVWCNTCRNACFFCSEKFDGCDSIVKCFHCQNLIHDKFSCSTKMDRYVESGMFDLDRDSFLCKHCMDSPNSPVKGTKV